jgi:two-component sensor histidine kinase
MNMTSLQRDQTAELERTSFEVEVAGRFGMLPNYFRTAPGAPGLMEELWKITQVAYLDNPLPSLFKERLFVHLSRFCQVRYCVVRHVGFLMGRGRPAGDATAPPHTLAQIIRLLRRPALPNGPDLDMALMRLETYPNAIEIPLPETVEEQDVFAAATVLFLGTEKISRARDALCAALGESMAELITAYLAFIRTAHYWAMTHPDLVLEEDVEALLVDHKELAALLLNDPTAKYAEMNQHVYNELTALRYERDARNLAREVAKEREHAQEHQKLLINELNHRLKNTLMVVQSLAYETLARADVSPAALEEFIDRLHALAEAHDLLTSVNWEAANLSAVIAQAVSIYCTGVAKPRVRWRGPNVLLIPKTALSLSMAFHELTTNAAKYGALSNRFGSIDVSWTVEHGASMNRLKLLWEEIDGPAVAAPSGRGFGSRLIEVGLARELHGTAKLHFVPTGLLCTIDTPIPKLEAST